MKRLAISLSLALILAAGPALAAQTVTLKASTSAQGEVTLGDIFDGAGQAAPVAVGISVNPGQTITLNAAQVQHIAAQNGLTWVNDGDLRDIIVRSATAPAEPKTPEVKGPDPIARNSSAKGDQVLTFAHNLDTGEVVQADDLVWSVVPRAPAGAADEADDLIGKAAKHPIRSGAVASKRDVTAPIVIKRDDMVTVTFDQNGVHLSLQAKAKASAAVGDTIDLQNMRSTQVIQAVAAGPGRAVVGPAADALRAETPTDPSRLALR